MEKVNLFPKYSAYAQCKNEKENYGTHTGNSMLSLKSWLWRLYNSMEIVMIILSQENTKAKYIMKHILAKENYGKEPIKSTTS